MYLPATYYALPLFIGSAISIALVFLTWQRRQESGAFAFMVSMFALGIWSLGHANEIVTVELATKIFWHKIEYTAIPLVPAFWTLFLLQHEKRPARFMRIVTPLLLLEPCLFIFFTWTNDHYHLLWTNIALNTDTGLPHLVISRGIGFYVHTVCNYLVMLIAASLFLRMLWRNSSLSGLQVALCVLALLSPVFVNIFYVFGLNSLFPVDLTPFSLISIGMAIAWFAFRFQFWEILPDARNAIVESMSDGVIVLNKKNVVIDINPSARRLLGLLNEGILGSPIAEVMPSWPDLHHLHVLLDSPIVGQPRSIELMLLSDQTRYLDLAVSNLYDRRNRVTGRLLTLHDVTRRKLTEQALANERNTLTLRVEERTADLSEANAQLARAARLKDEFMASMSHELRTPLNTILGLSEALQEQVYGSLTPKQNKALHSIEESGRHLLALINDILDVSKIEAGQLSLDIHLVSVDSVCQASLGLVKQIALKKQLTVTSHIDPDVKMLEADERRLKQMLVNLLSNAVKFTSEGGQIGLEVTGDKQEEAVRFCVWDTGIGIAPEDMKRLFQPFVQLDSSTARQHEGTGLGLALVYRMAEMHGGSVKAESKVGEGSRFTISLPWHLAAVDLTMKQNAPIPTSISEINRALIINDSQTDAEQVAQYLREFAIHPVIYTRTDGVVKYVQTVSPDLIILDLFLPDRFGWDILAELRANPQTRPIPVIVVSLMDITPPPHLVTGANGGKVEMLLKHFSREQLHRSLLSLTTTKPTDTPELVAAPIIHSIKPTPETPSASSYILLVEDNETNISTFSDYLQAKGYRVQVARTGHEALARAAEAMPDLILLDIQMPGMDGLEVMQHIRADATLYTIPIIALTALAMPGDRERCLQAGANDYLSKPISLRTLISTIETNLQHSLVPERA